MTELLNDVRKYKMTDLQNDLKSSAPSSIIFCPWGRTDKSKAEPYYI